MKCVKEEEEKGKKEEVEREREKPGGVTDGSWLKLEPVA